MAFWIPKFLIAQIKAKALGASGFEEFLGGSTEAREIYWRSLLEDFPEDIREMHFCKHADRARATQPIALYGDEATILSESTMFWQWTPEISPYRTNSMLSRFFITMMPSTCYVVVDKVTLLHVKALETSWA